MDRTRSVAPGAVHRIYLGRTVRGRFLSVLDAASICLEAPDGYGKFYPFQW